jgi:hypothetical protein
MGSLTEATFARTVEGGCPACGGKKLSIRAYVEGRFPLMSGEPVGGVAWAYKGEGFVDGVFEIRCAACKLELFADAICPRCHAPDGLARALETPNAHERPRECPRCNAQTLAYRAFAPAIVAYEGRRADKARTHCTPEDDGFHGVSAECKACGPFASVSASGGCPLCGAAGPLRAQPR